MRATRTDRFGFASRCEIPQLHQKTSVSTAEKTGQVLVRTCTHPGAQEPQRFQTLTLAMSGAPKLADLRGGDWLRDHDVSILIGVGAGYEVGCMPAAKVSMMIMRLPQRGQGHVDWG
jgi:hypothetical protein